MARFRVVLRLFFVVSAHVAPARTAFAACGTVWRTAKKKERRDAGLRWRWVVHKKERQRGLFAATRGYIAEVPSAGLSRTTRSPVIV